MKLTNSNAVNVYCEITPLTDRDLFIVLDNKQAKFDYPVHYHSDYELNIVMGCSGERIVGDSVEHFEDLDVALLGPRLPHAWRAESLPSTRVITLQFDKEFINAFTLSKNIFQPIYDILLRSANGITFRGKTADVVKEKALQLCNERNFNSVLHFYDILNTLATSPLEEQVCYNTLSYDSSVVVRESKSRRIETICQYIKDNYQQSITLEDIASLANMSTSAVSHFFKKRTNRTFSSYLSDVRIGNASRLLVETTRPINDIAFECGFDNISNFNRIFKHYKSETPREYRANVLKVMTKY